MEKTPERTRYWVHVCMLVEREMGRLKAGEKSGMLREHLREYCAEQRDKAASEGFDDTAQYMQHVLDDLEPKP